MQTMVHLTPRKCLASKVLVIAACEKPVRKRAGPKPTTPTPNSACFGSFDAIKTSKTLTGIRKRSVAPDNKRGPSRSSLIKIRYEQLSRTKI